MPIQKPATCKKEDPCWRCRGFASQSWCPLRRAFKKWQKDSMGGETFDYRANSVERIEPVDPVEREDQEKEVKQVQEVKSDKPDTIKREPMPDIEHPECYAPNCDEPRVKSPKSRRTGGYMLVCEGHKHDQSAKIKAGWNRKKERDAAAGAGASRVKKAVMEDRPRASKEEPLEDYDEVRKARGLEPNLIEPPSGRDSALSLERELLKKLLDEIEVPPDLRQRMDLIVLLVDRIVGP